MNGNVSEQTPPARETVPAGGEPAAKASLNGATHPAAAPPVGFPESRYGPLGVLAKRIVGRIINPWVVRQQVVDDSLWTALAEMQARFAGWDFQRAQLTEAEVLELRRDLSAAAFDFGRIADRMRALDNVRRIVERSAPFRRDVRTQRRDILELRQQLAALSARLTLVQRELPPIRAANAELRETLDGAVAAESAARSREIDAAAQTQRAERHAEIADAAHALRALLDAERNDRHAEIESADKALRALLDAADSTLRDDFAASLAQFGSFVEMADRLRARLLATPYMAIALDEWQPSRRSAAGDLDYLGFEAVFRGPEEFVRERLRAYLPLVEAHAPVVELGCGRGEFLELLREHGIAASGVDINPEAVAHCRARGLDRVMEADANGYLASLPHRTVGTVFSAQVAEHLAFDDLVRNLACALDVLEPGGLYIAETINANSIEGGKTFFVDPSHVKPLFPEVFAWLCKSVGFAQVRVFYPNGAGFDETDPTSQHEYAVVATA